MTNNSTGGAHRVVGMGEILWDLLPDRRVLGGATANFAFFAKALGAVSAVVSRVGEDVLGEEILEQVRARDIETSLLEKDPSHPTGTVSVTVDPQGQPSYVIHEDVAWDFIEGGSATECYLKNADAVCYGTLGQRGSRSRQTIRDLLQAVPDSSLKIFDVNLRQSFYSKEVIEESLAFANVLKLNDEELPVVAEMLGVAGTDEERLEELARRFSLRLVALTRGSAGAVLWSDQEVSTHAGFPAEVKDTVGAGDSFTAAVAMGLLSDHSLERINDQANRVASWVCAHDGAAPELPEEYGRWFVRGEE